MSAEEPSVSEADSSDIGDWEDLTLSAVAEYKPQVKGRSIQTVVNDRPSADGAKEYLVEYTNGEVEWAPATAFSTPDFLEQYENAQALLQQAQQYQQMKDRLKASLRNRPDLLTASQVAPIPEGSEPSQTHSPVPPAPLPERAPDDASSLGAAEEMSGLCAEAHALEGCADGAEPPTVQEPRLPADPLPPVRHMSRKSSGSQRDSSLGSDMVIVGPGSLCSGPAYSINSSLLQTDSDNSNQRDSTQPSVTASQFAAQEHQGRVEGQHSPNTLPPAPDSPLPSLGHPTPPGSPGNSPRGRPPMSGVDPAPLPALSPQWSGSDSPAHGLNRTSSRPDPPPSSPLPGLSRAGSRQPEFGRGASEETMLSMTQSLMEEKDPECERSNGADPAPITLLPSPEEEPVMNPGDWGCPHCTLVNQRGHEVCQACGAKHDAQPAPVQSAAAPPPPELPHDVPTGWTPAFCYAEKRPFYINVKGHEFWDRPTVSCVGTWTCPTCTFDNEEDVDACAMCQTAKPEPSEPRELGKVTSKAFLEGVKQGLEVLDTVGQKVMSGLGSLAGAMGLSGGSSPSPGVAPPPVEQEQSPRPGEEVPGEAAVACSEFVPIGAIVRIHGLKNAQQYNNRKARVTGCDGSGRCQLMLQNEDGSASGSKQIAVRPANLTLVSIVAPRHSLPEAVRAPLPPFPGDGDEKAEDAPSSPALRAVEPEPQPRCIGRRESDLALDLADRLSAALVVMDMDIHDGGAETAKFDLTRDEIGLVESLLRQHLAATASEVPEPVAELKANPMSPPGAQDAPEESPAHAPAPCRSASPPLPVSNAVEPGLEVQVMGDQGSREDGGDDLDGASFVDVPTASELGEESQPSGDEAEGVLEGGVLPGSNLLVVREHTDETVPYASTQNYEGFWKLENTGESALTFDYQLHHLYGDRMGMEVDDDGIATQYASKQQLGPGEDFEVVLMLTMPEVDVPRRFYETAWQLRTADGQTIGPPLYLRLEVKQYVKEQETMVRNLVSMGFSRKDVITLLEARRYSGDLSVHAVALCQNAAKM